LSALAQTVDPDGRIVVLDEEGWGHILREHAELALYQEEVIATVRSPGHRSHDYRPRRERYYRRDLGPSRWLFVVNFDEIPARIVTAYGNRKDPPGWTKP
jgi:hypothetical protein